MSDSLICKYLSDSITESVKVSFKGRILKINGLGNDIRISIPLDNLKIRGNKSETYITLYDVNTLKEHCFLFETDNEVELFIKNIEKMRNYEEGILYHEGTKKILFIGSFVGRGGDEGTESTGKGTEFYLNGSKRYEGETFRGKHNGVGDFFSEDGLFKVEMYEIHEGRIATNEEIKITFVKTGYSVNVMLLEELNVDKDVFDVRTFAMNNMKDIDSLMFPYLSPEEQLFNLKEKYDILEKKYYDLSFGIKDNYCKYIKISNHIDNLSRIYIWINTVIFTGIIINKFIF